VAQRGLVRRVAAGRRETNDVCRVERVTLVVILRLGSDTENFDLLQFRVPVGSIQRCG
jgi:hypothetical protein